MVQGVFTTQQKLKRIATSVTCQQSRAMSSEQSTWSNLVVLASTHTRSQAPTLLLGHWMGDQEQVELHRKYLEGTLRVDLFGLKEDGAIDGVLQAPLSDSAQVEKGEDLP